MTLTEIRAAHEADMAYRDSDGCLHRNAPLEREAALIQLLDQCVPFIAEIADGIEINFDRAAAKVLLQSLAEAKPI